jgi:hypothetical protein
VKPIFSNEIMQEFGRNGLASSKFLPILFIGEKIGVKS